MSFNFLRDVDMNKVHFKMFQVTHHVKGKKQYSQDYGSKIGGFYTLCASAMIFAYTNYLLINMFTANIDTIVLKNLVIDFDDDHGHAEDKQRYFHNQTLFPTMDVETIGNGDVSKYDIKFDHDSKAGTFEFTPI